jgi:hypothetical protein
MRSMKISNFDKLALEAFVLILLFFTYGVLIGILAQTKTTANTLIIFSAILIPAFTYLFRRIADALQDRYLGLKSEYNVSIILNELGPEGVRSVHDLVVDEKRGNIDHIAVAKNGVWVITSRYFDGEISLKEGLLYKDGRLFPKNILEEAFTEASALHDTFYRYDVTDAPVRPVLIFSGRYSLAKFWFDPINRVYVVSNTGLSKLITNSKFEDCLTEDQVEKIVKYLNRFKKVKKAKTVCLTAVPE